MRRAGAVGGVALSLLALPPGVAAQSAEESLLSQCVAQAGAAAQAGCGDAVLALYALQGGVGLLLSAGGPLPVSPSTAGRRLATQPRVVVDGGLAWASFRHPDLSGPVSAPGAPDRRTFLIGGRVAAVVGIFEGFSPLPGVGGVLSLDGVGIVQLLRVPGIGGAAESVMAWGGGLRLGIVRESFSLPGVTLSLMHHRAGAVDYGTTGGSGARVALDPRVTSLRAIVGKDLLAMGLSSGVGWDEQRGSGRVEARVPNEVPGATAPWLEGRAGPVGLEARRRYLFAGANLTWLVTQLAGELAWVWDSSPVPAIEGGGPYRPGATEIQGALTVRIVY